MPRDRSRSPAPRSRRHDDEPRRKRSRSRDKGGRDRSREDRNRDKDYGSDRERRRRRGEDSEGGSGDKKGKEKEHKKRRETSTERLDRKAREKAARKAEKKALRDEEDRAAAAEVSIYSAQDNPFHDADLSSKFNWAKKREKEKQSGMSAYEAQQRDEARRAEAKDELERLNARRAQREQEMELREAEASRMAQMAESAQMAEWIAKEDDFQLEQAQKRAEIRVRENRAKPIDLLALNLKWGNPDGTKKEKTNKFDDEEDDGAGLEVDLDEPYRIFDNLTLEETQELEEDIKMHLSLEKDPRNREFWLSLSTVCADSLLTLNASRNANHDALRTTDAIKADVNRLLEGKPFEKLVELEGSIERKLTSGDPIDVEYWEGLLRELKVWKAKAKLKTMHEVVLRNRLEQLRRRQRDEALKVQNELASALARPDQVAVDENTGPTAMVVDGEAEEEEEEQELAELYQPGMSPPLLERVHPDDHALEVLFVKDDWHKLLQARRTVLQTRFVPKPRAAAADDDTEALDRDALAEKLYKQEAEKGLDEEEEMFDMEAELGEEGGNYSWEDKYRPRKPRYFNKVHTGYEWNKYNQTHYDSDNPPPKVVQGYKFNIFYPDLIDKTKAPTYKIIKNKENEDIVTLLFTAGPPYEDIAFTIVNKGWEHSHKRGFKSSFDRGVLQLHFTLARIHYRK